LSSFCKGQQANETIFRFDDAIPKQRGALLVGNKTRTPAMQFILDLIWNRSRSKFLATIGEPDAEL
jgi:hypothetical protein